MNQRVRTIFEQAQKLAPNEREVLAELLLGTIEPDTEFEQLWAQEAHRRWDEHVASSGKTVDALEAVEDVRRRD